MLDLSTFYKKTATKRIADFDRKIAMYTERRDKAIAAANKKFGLNICVDDIIVKENTNGRYTWKEYSLPASIRDAIGFETYIEDGQPRFIHARVIWAAEYSDFVQPHIRYLVTERTVKIG